MSAARAFTFVLVAACAVAAASVAASKPAADRPTADRPVIGDLRTCGTRGDSNRPAKEPAKAVRIGPLMIWPSVRMTGPTIDTTWTYAAKAPVLLPARMRVVLAIAPEAVAQAALWSHRGGYVSAVRFQACREREPSRGYRGTVGKLTGFPFAIGLTERSACVPMEVWPDGQDTPIRRIVPVGRPSC